MRRIAVLIMVFVLLFGCVGCVNGTDDPQNNTQPSTEQTGLNTAIDLPAELNAQNKYINPINFQFQEAEGFFCGRMFSSSQHYIHYYDKATGISGVLCADPICAHDSVECGAYTYLPVCIYNGKLYRTIIDTFGTGDMLLYESDLSGMNRKAVMQIDWDDVLLTYQPQRYILHQGKLYLVGRAPAASGTEVGYRVSLLSRPLDSDEPFTVLYDEVFSGGEEEVIRFIGNDVYLSVATFQDGGPYGVTITRFDTQSGEAETVYQKSDMTEIPGAVWVTDDHEIYLPGYTEEKAYLWKLENDERTEIKSWNTGREPDVGEDIVVVISKENDTKFVEVCDFSGNSIYSGKLFPDSIDGVGYDPNTCGIGFFGGDREKLILILIGEDHSEYVVMIDLTNNMEATLLWSGTV